MMRRLPSLCLVALLAAGSVAGAATAGGDHSMHAGMQMASAAQDKLGEGVVKKIDKAGKKVTLAHGALPNGMPPMTMAYRVKDAAWLDQLKVGQKIRFATDDGEGMTVVRFEPVK